MMGTQQCLIMDNEDQPTVVYKDFNNGMKASVLSWNGSVWQALGGLGVSEGEVEEPGLALDIDGNPVVVFEDHAYGGKLSVMAWDGVSWNYIGEPGFTPGVAWDPTLAVDHSGRPVVFFVDFTIGNGRGSAMRWDGAQWNYLGEPGFTIGGAYFMSLAISLGGDPVVAFMDSFNGQKVTVKRWNGSAWISIGNPGFSAGIAGYISMAIDGNDNPAVAYNDGAYDGKTTVMHWNGNTWETVGDPGFSAGNSFGQSLALDSDDNPVVSFHEYDISRAMVMRLVDQGSSCIAVLTPQMTSVPATSVAGLEVSVALPNVCDWTAVSNNPEMITITSGGSGSGNGTIVYSVSANPEITPRTGTLTVGESMFEVTQAGSNPITFTITASTQPENLIYHNPVPLPANPYLKICADGSRATWFTVSVTGGPVDLEQLKFRVAGGNGDIGYSGAFNNEYAFGSNSTSTRFRHPRYMDDPGYGRYDEVEVYSESDPSVVLASITVRFYRSAMVFVHGFGGDISTFENMALNTLLPAGYYPYVPGLQSESPLLWRADYAIYSLARFSTNSTVLPFAINRALNQAISNGYSSGSVSVVAHSMGGLLARMYVQSTNDYTYRNDINRLITLNTPHYGTQAANYLMNNTGVLSAVVLLLTSTPGMYGAVQDMNVNSDPIRYQINIAQPETVPSVTIATDEDGEQSGEALYVALSAILYRPISTGIFGMNIYDGDDHDLIVPRASQRCGIFNEPVIPEQWHIGSAADGLVTSRVIALMNSDPAGSSFVQFGFPVGQLYFPISPTPSDLEGPSSRDRSSSSMEIISPAAGAVYTPGEFVQVSVEYSAELTEMLLLITGGGVDPFIVESVAQGSLQFQIPGNAVGNMQLSLLGSDGTDWVASDESYITILSTAIPDSIRATPDAIELPLGYVHLANVIGYFNGEPVGLHSSPDLERSYDVEHLVYEGNGIFRAIEVGITEVVFTYQGRSDTATFTIIDDPDALVASFDYTNESICMGGTVSFTNQSLGLVTGYEWNFPGGVPSTSTDVSPTVSYQVPGNYRVSLVTTFVNGVDSLVIEDLVAVIDNPEPTIIADGDSLRAFPDDAAYQWIDCNNGNSAIPGANGQVFVPTANSNYAVEVQVNGCTGISTCYPYFTTGVVGPQNAFGLTIRPNPNSGAFHLSVTGPWKNADVEVWDMSGRVVLTMNLGERTEIPVQLDVSSGVYVLAVRSEKMTAEVQVVVQR